MKIHGVDNLTYEQLSDELRRGAKFVVYQYAISVLVMSFRRGSEIYFVRSGESAVAKGWSYSVISFFAGWWGFPWGPIFTIGSLWTNFSGGKDVTAEVVRALRPAPTPPPVPRVVPV